MPGQVASEQLRMIGLRLEEGGNGALFSPIRAEIVAHAEPLVHAAQEAAQRMLPHKGGLNEWVAGQHIRISVLTSAATAGVRLTGPPSIRSGGQTNQGYVRHPVFGDREAWVTEQTPGAGWWSTTLAEDSAAITPQIVATINRVNEWIQAV
jgi:hypothetical protein